MKKLIMLFGLIDSVVIVTLVEDLIAEYIGTKIINFGIAFGLVPANGFNILISILIIGYIFWYLWNKKDLQINAETLGFSLILVGALSNLHDRLRYGGVVDFIEIHRVITVFNIADCLVVIGAIIILHQLIYNRDKKI